MFIWTCDDASGNMWSPKLLHKFNDVVWHVSWSITANILAVSGGDNKVYPTSRASIEALMVFHLLACTVNRGRSESSQSLPPSEVLSCTTQEGLGCIAAV